MERNQGEGTQSGLCPVPLFLLRIYAPEAIGGKELNRVCNELHSRYWVV